MTATDPQQAFDFALRQHQAGRLAEAEQAYREILRTAPDHGDTLHLLGMLLNQTGRADAALPPLRRAAALRPDYAPLQHNLGVVLFGLGQLEAAVLAYRAALALKPLYAEALNNLGVALYRLGEEEEAVACYLQALAIKPEYAEAHNHLGIALQDQGRLEEAAARFREAMATRPDFAQPHNNLGLLLFAQGRVEQAMACYRQALSRDPHNIDAQNNLGIALFSQGRTDDAIACYRALLALAPDHASANHNLAGALHAQGKFDEALMVYRKVLQAQPGNHAARHMIAAMEGGESERAPDAYVASVFDEYADSFDSHLQQALEYTIPRQLVSLISRFLQVAESSWEVLDLGCGSGLVGEALSGRAKRLVGVDLSAGMLEKARAKNLYTHLLQSDLLAAMRDEPAENYDVIAAADVFVYAGRLDGIVAEAKRLLRPGGLFAFSVEAITAAGTPREMHAADYQLQPNGRYRHSYGYLTSLGQTHGFSTLKLLEATIRVENRVPAPGWIVLWGA